MTRKILFVTHQCSGTGAPILLLNIMKGLREIDAFSTIDVYAILGGELLSEFKSFGRFSLSPSFSFDNIIQAGIEECYDIVYFNTVETAHLIPHFIQSGIIKNDTRVVSHIHELDGTIKKAGVDCLEPIKERADVIICVSNAVMNNLQKYDIPIGRINVVYPFMVRDFEFIPPVLRSSSPFTIIGCGEITVGKGIDIFLQVAKKVIDRTTHDIQFIWIGPDSNKIQQYFEDDIVKLGMEKWVSFAGFQEDVRPWFDKANLLFLSSRQDSFPLVCLEAASSGLPIMYFPDAGGIQELLGCEGGVQVQYLNVDSARDNIFEVCNNDTLLEEKAQFAKNAFHEKCNMKNSLMEIHNLIL